MQNINTSVIRTKSRWVYLILLIIGIIILILLIPNLSQPELLPSDDFVQVWAGGKLNLSGSNPFDPQEIERLQIEAHGIPSGDYAISIMLNPPWSIALIMPFGLLPYPIGRMIWLILSISLILISTLLFCQTIECSNQRKQLAIIAAFCLGPTISVLVVGQITPVVLLGFTGFLYFSQKKGNDVLAGVFLCLASIKPQLALLVWLAILFWVIKERRYKILLSTIFTTLLLLVIALLFNPHLIQQYINMTITYPISDWATPTLGAYFRYFIFDSDKFWLQFIPTFFGGIWLIIFWKRHRNSWNWSDKLPLLLFISCLTSSYSWTYDQVLLIPAILQAVIWLFSDSKRWWIILMAFIYLFITILDLLLHRNLSDFWFIWLAPSYFAWYLIVYWQHIFPIRSTRYVVTRAE